MKYRCKNCGFIHLGELNDGYYCPYCLGSLFDFELIEEEEKKYNRVNISEDNHSIYRIDDRCINCGACFRTCQNKVNIKYDSNKCNGVCIGCGQCILSCPVGALVPKYDYNKVLEYINNPEYIVAVLTSPAVRVGIGDAFGYEAGAFLEGKMVAALKALGFDYVFDTTFGADLTSMEEAHELKLRIEKNKKGMFTSCCPSWVKYASIYHPDILKDLSSCDSPIGMGSTIIKKYFAKEEDIDLSKFILVALTPCTSKKEEIINGSCDYVLTTSELSLMLRENNVDFKALEDEEFDSIVGSSSGTIYGFSGGVALSVLRVLYYYETGKDLTNDLVLISDKEYYKEIKVKINSKIIKCASVSTMGNLEKLLNIKDEFDLIEVMNCDGGCISGGGQILMPIADMQRIKEERSKSLQKKDYKPLIKYPYKNEYIKEIYDEFLEKPGSNISKKLLHVKHKDLSDVLTNKKETSD